MEGEGRQGGGAGSGRGGGAGGEEEGEEDPEGEREGRWGGGRRCRKLGDKMSQSHAQPMLCTSGCRHC